MPLVSQPFTQGLLGFPQHRQVGFFLKDGAHGDGESGHGLALDLAMAKFQVEFVAAFVQKILALWFLPPGL